MAEKTTVRTKDGKVIEVSSRDAAQGFMLGDLSPVGDTVYFRKGGAVAKAKASDSEGLRKAISSGWEPTTEAEYTLRADREGISGLETLAEGAVHAAQSVLPVVRQGLEATGSEFFSKENQGKRMRNIGRAGLTGIETAAVLGTAVASGGSGGLAKLSGATVSGRAALAAESAAMAGTRLGRAAGVGAVGAAEGAAVGYGQAVNESYIEDRELSSELIASYVVPGMVMGGGAAFGLGLLTKGAKPTMPAKQFAGRSPAEAFDEAAGVLIKSDDGLSTAERVVASSEGLTLGGRNVPGTGRYDSARRIVDYASLDPKGYQDLIADRHPVIQSAVEPLADAVNNFLGKGTRGGAVEFARKNGVEIAEMYRGAPSFEAHAPRAVAMVENSMLLNNMRKSAKTGARSMIDEDPGLHHVLMGKEARDFFSGHVDRIESSLRRESLADVHMTLQRAKKSLDDYRKKLTAAPDTLSNTATIKEIDVLKSQVDVLALDESLFGEVARKQAAYNKVTAAAKEAKEHLENVSRGKVNLGERFVTHADAMKLIRSRRYQGGDQVGEAMQAALDAERAAFRYGVDELGWDPKKAAEYLKDADYIAKVQDGEVGALIKLKMDWDEQRKIQTGNSASINALQSPASMAAAGAGAVVGGLPGAAIGGIASSLLQPISAASNIAALKIALDDAAKYLFKGASKTARGISKSGKRSAARGAAETVLSGAAEHAKRVPKAVKYKLPQTTRFMNTGDPDAEEIERISDSVRRFAEAPHLTIDADGEMTALAAIAPELAAMSTVVAHRAATFLEENKPHIHRNVFSTAPPLVEPEGARRYMRYVEAIGAPERTFARIADDTFTVDHRVALKAVYPEMYSRVSRELAEAMALSVMSGKDVPYSKRVTLGVVLGIPTDATLDPAMLSRIQATHAGTGTPPPPPEQKGGYNLRSSAPPLEKNVATQYDKVESGDARK